MIASKMSLYVYVCGTKSASAQIRNHQTRSFKRLTRFIAHRTASVSTALPQTVAGHNLLTCRRSPEFDFRCARFSVEMVSPSEEEEEEEEKEEGSPANNPISTAEAETARPCRLCFRPSDPPLSPLPPPPPPPPLPFSPLSSKNHPTTLPVASPTIQQTPR